jgi:hypothetical protein
LKQPIKELEDEIIFLKVKVKKYKEIIYFNLIKEEV